MTCIFQGIDMDMEWLGQWTRVEEKKHKKISIGRPLVYCTHAMHILRHALSCDTHGVHWWGGHMTCIFQGIDMDMEWLGQWPRIDKKKHKNIYIRNPLVYCTHLMHILRHASFLWHTWGALTRWASNLVYIDNTLVQPQWHQQLQLLTFFCYYPSCYNYDSELLMM